MRAMLVRGGALGRLAGAACVAGGPMVGLGLNDSPAWLVILLYAAGGARRRAPSER